jgi:hypothetical protein
MSVNIDREALNALMEELDLKARQQHAGDKSEAYWVCQRRHPRYAFRADCVIRFLSPTHEVMTLPARTRNLSRGGLGLLARHVFHPGDPVEVELQLPNQPLMFMAGLIQFVRYAGRGYHELGIALKSAGREPVFSNNPVVALQTLEWMKRPAYAG